MISAAKWAREKNIPYLGICLGFQIAVIEFARNVLGLQGKHLPFLSFVVFSKLTMASIKQMLTLPN